MYKIGLSSLSVQDFGEYQESYYSVQTTEGEQISQLIAGYIDIILKKVRRLSLGRQMNHKRIDTRFWQVKSQIC